MIIINHSSYQISKIYMYYSTILITRTIRQNMCKTFRDIELSMQMNVKIRENAFDLI